MVTKLSFLIFLVLALGGCATTDAPRSAAAAPGEGENPVELAEDDPNRIVCRREHVVGSNFKRRICRTVREIEEERLASQKTLDQERMRMTEKALPRPIGN